MSGKDARTQCNDDVVHRAAVRLGDLLHVVEWQGRECDSTRRCQCPVVRHARPTAGGGSGLAPGCDELQQGGGETVGAGEGSRSKNPDKAKIPETPSTALWWILATTANCLSSKPSTNHASHNGRSFGSGWEAMSPATSASASRPRPSTRT